MYNIKNRKIKRARTRKWIDFPLSKEKTYKHKQASSTDKNRVFSENAQTWVRLEEMFL